MQKTVITFILSLLFIPAIAQDARLGCDDKAIRLQSQQLKQELKAQGLTVIRDAMLSMESRQPYPIGIQLEKGQLYQFVYVGDRRSSRIDFEMFDGNDKKIDQRSQKSPEENNIIYYSFTPEKTDVYLLVLSQRWKSNTMCGGFTIMQKTESAQQPGK